MGTAWRGREWNGLASQGKDKALIVHNNNARPGWVRRGWARPGKDRQVSARMGAARRGKALQGKDITALIVYKDNAWTGVVRQVPDRLGLARQG